jgi:hypothetical protein
MMMHPQPIVASMWKGHHLYLVQGDRVNRAHFEIRGDELRFIVELEDPDAVAAHIGSWFARVYVDGMDWNSKGSKEMYRVRVDKHWRSQGIILFRAPHIVGEHDCHIVLELKRRDKVYLFVWNFHPKNLSKR